MALSGEYMADDKKTLKEIAEERGIELKEYELEVQPTDLPKNIIWWSKESLKAQEGYSVLSSWEQIVVEKDDVDEVNKFMKNMGCKHPIQIVGCVQTLPDYEHRSMNDPPTGGRIDFLFYFHNDDIYRVAVRRLQHGIRWWEDVMGNCQHRADEGGITLENESIHPRELLIATGYLEE